MYLFKLPKRWPWGLPGGRWEAMETISWPCQVLLIGETLSHHPKGGQRLCQVWRPV